MSTLTNFDTYDPAYFRRLFDIEDRHFWFAGRNHILSRFLSKLAADADAPKTVVEIGCGTGNVLRTVKTSLRNATVVGMDLFFEGLALARTRTAASLVEGDLQNHPFRTGIDLVCLFDVLEHIPDDLAALRGVRAMLASGGRLLITVPLHPSLWSEFDELSHHVRRYTIQELLLKMRKTGFSVEYASPYMASTLPPMWLRRKFFGGGENRRARADNELSIVPLVNGILLALLRLESGWITRGRQLPFGSSMILLARGTG